VASPFGLADPGGIAAFSVFSIARYCGRGVDDEPRRDFLGGASEESEGVRGIWLFNTIAGVIKRAAAAQPKTDTHK